MARRPHEADCIVARRRARRDLLREEGSRADGRAGARAPNGPRRAADGRKPHRDRRRGRRKARGGPLEPPLRAGRGGRRGAGTDGARGNGPRPPRRAGDRGGSRGGARRRRSRSGLARAREEEPRPFRKTLGAGRRGRDRARPREAGRSLGGGGAGVGAGGRTPRRDRPRAGLAHRAVRRCRGREDGLAGRPDGSRPASRTRRFAFGPSRRGGARRRASLDSVAGRRSRGRDRGPCGQGTSGGDRGRRGSLDAAPHGARGPAGRLRARDRVVRAPRSARGRRAEALCSREGRHRPRRLGDRLGCRTRWPGRAALRPDRRPGRGLRRGPFGSRSRGAGRGRSSGRPRGRHPGVVVTLDPKTRLAVERRRPDDPGGGPYGPPNPLGIAGRLAQAFVESKLTPLFVLFALALGALAVVVTPREEEPQIKVPMIDVFAAAPGWSSVEMERRLIAPLEKEFWSVPGVEYVYSTSSPDRGFVVIRFRVGEDPDRALVRIRSKLDALADRW